jgi:hypothetical protein
MLGRARVGEAEGHDGRGWGPGPSPSGVYLFDLDWPVKQRQNSYPTRQDAFG